MGKTWFEDLNMSRESVEDVKGRANSLLVYVGQAPQSKGRELLKKHLSGVVLTRAQAVTAFCCNCCGNYADGRIDCENYTCPLYRFMPYGRFRKRYIRKERKEDGNSNEEHVPEIS